MSDTLFNIPTKKKPLRRVPDPQPRLTSKPRWAKCACGATILEALPAGGMETVVDPITLTPAGIQAATLLNRAVYRASVGHDWMPQELLRAWPEDLAFFPHHQFYWHPTHVCGKPLLEGTRIRAAPPKPPTPTNPPF